MVPELSQIINGQRQFLESLYFYDYLFKINRKIRSYMRRVLVTGAVGGQATGLVANMSSRLAYSK
jgi:hypothetical protein